LKLISDLVVALGSFINCIYGSAIGGRGTERINGTQMTRMTRIIAGKTKKVQRQSALSASSAFYRPVHWSENSSRADDLTLFPVWA
jgi:hypothetical protein